MIPTSAGLLERAKRGQGQASVVGEPGGENQAGLQLEVAGEVRHLAGGCLSYGRVIAYLPSSTAEASCEIEGEPRRLQHLQAPG